MANTGFGGVNVRQSGSNLLVRTLLQNANSLVTSGTVSLYLWELQSDGTINTYDFNDNTFKATAVTTETAAMTYRKSNNASTDTGLWTYQLAPTTGFTIGAIYMARVHCTGATPYDQVREFQWGGSELNGPFKYNTANGFEFYAVLSSDNKTPATGITFTKTRVIGSTSATAGGTVTEVGSGRYYYSGVAADFNGAATGFLFASATTNPVFFTANTV